MTSLPSADSIVLTRRLYRDVGHRWIGGVASGLAAHLGVRPRNVRIAFVLVSLSAGLGLLLYGAFWIVVPPDPDGPPQSRRTSTIELALALAAVAFALIGVARETPLGWWFIPSVLSGFGGLLIWQQATESDRDRWRRLSRESLCSATPDRTALFRIGSGVALVITGAGFIAARVTLEQMGVVLVAVVVTVTGIALVTGPWWSRLVGELAQERRERIRADERADIAAHLHDGVLQTLALIQRNAESPREVTRLARSQERELRSRLYGAPSSGQFGSALQLAAGEVEDTYAVAVDVVVVGDCPLDARLDAVVAAAREAMVNAAKHSGETSVSVYAEVDTSSVSVFVRDRGVGFDPGAVPDDRQGLRGSIIGRLERNGGNASVRSAVGEGTEVRLTMELGERG